ncbi:MAG TPA: hydrogenase maturation protease [Candidatus Lokiarchaeia archaeon]|nr:hydrogenase maturation protease [Candidatus Lokiarchaeia archaeon]
MESRDFEIILLQRLDDCHHIVVIGIGADLREDDAVGNLLACELVASIKELLDTMGNNDYVYSENEYIRGGQILVLNASVAPEQYISMVKGFAPEKIIIVDAAKMGAAANPGDMAFIETDELDMSTFSTHTISLRYFIEILKTMGLDAEFFVIGIQPASLGYGEALSRPVEETKVFLKSLLLEYMQRNCLNT